MAERRPRLSPNLAAVLVLAVLAGAIVLWQRPWQGADDGPVAIPVDASAVLTRQFRELASAGSEQSFVAGMGGTPAADDLGTRTWASLRAVGASDLDLRYISGGDVADRVDGSSTAVVEVAWRAGESSGLDPRTTHRSSVAFRVAPLADGTFAVTGARARSGVLPIWLTGLVEVERGSGHTILTLDGGDDRLPLGTMATAARSAVTRLVPGATGELTVVSPRTPAQAAEVLGQDVDSLARIAAVTAPLDARDGPASDSVVVLNPEVFFSTMDRRAAQIVLTHEATHVLTTSVGTSAPSWVVEGFADFVALHDDTAPLSVSAGQILAAVRRGEVPSRLPSSQDFGSAGPGLGAVYESTWMVFRMLGEQHGDRAVVSFYEAVIDGSPLDRALASAFGLTEAELTDSWRAYLTKSASTVS